MLDKFIKWGTLYSFLVSTFSFVLALKLYFDSRRKLKVSLFIGEIKGRRFIYMNKMAENPDLIFLEAVSIKKAPIMLTKAGFIMKDKNILKDILIDTHPPAYPLMRLPRKLDEGDVHRVWMRLEELMPAIKSKNIKYGFFEDSLGKRHKAKRKELKKIYELFDNTSFKK